MVLLCFCSLHGALWLADQEGACSQRVWGTHPRRTVSAWRKPHSELGLGLILVTPWSVFGPGPEPDVHLCQSSLRILRGKALHRQGPMGQCEEAGPPDPAACESEEDRRLPPSLSGPQWLLMCSRDHTAVVWSHELCFPPTHHCGPSFHCIPSSLFTHLACGLICPVFHFSALGSEVPWPAG